MLRARSRTSRTCTFHLVHGRHLGGHLATEDHDGGAVHERVLQGRDGVGGARAGGHQHHAGLAHGASVALRHVAGALLVAREDEVEVLALVDGVEHGQDGAARVAEDAVHAHLGQRLVEDLGAGLADELVGGLGRRALVLLLHLGGGQLSRVVQRRSDGRLQAAGGGREGTACLLLLLRGGAERARELAGSHHGGKSAEDSADPDLTAAGAAGCYTRNTLKTCLLKRPFRATCALYCQRCVGVTVDGLVAAAAELLSAPDHAAHVQLVEHRGRVRASGERLGLSVGRVRVAAEQHQRLVRVEALEQQALARDVRLRAHERRELGRRPHERRQVQDVHVQRAALPDFVALALGDAPAADHRELLTVQSNDLHAEAS
ncbi:hypothetical protein ON010_g15786 [Phytophthora cinnamomi]|nr:hypothetical protein ON010_g15786 [Phytophthora cinnamomi]